MLVGLGDADADGLALALADGEAVAEADGEGDGEAVAEADGEGDGDGDAVGLLAPARTPMLGGPGVVLVGAGVTGAVPAKATRAAIRAAATPPAPTAVSTGAREGRLPVF